MPAPPLFDSLADVGRRTMLRGLCASMFSILVPTLMLPKEFRVVGYRIPGYYKANGRDDRWERRQRVVLVYQTSTGRLLRVEKSRNLECA